MIKERKTAKTMLVISLKRRYCHVHLKSIHLIAGIDYLCDVETKKNKKTTEFGIQQPIQSLFCYRRLIIQSQK